MTSPRSGDMSSYVIGTIVSFVFHIVFFAAALHHMANSAANFTDVSQVFTVTLEGGSKLGGMVQLPKPGAAAQKLQNQAPPEKTAETGKSKQETVKEQTKTPAKPVDTVKSEQGGKQLKPEDIETTTAIDEAKVKAEAEAKKLAEKKEAEKKIAEKKLAEKKKQDEAKKKAEADKKLKADEAKKAAEKKAAEKKKADELAKKKAAEAEKAAKAKRFEDAIARSKQRYEGESYDAGGVGYGAAVNTGGQGTGGGTLASYEFVAYRNQLEAHIKEGWRWLSGTNKLRAQVLISIRTDGVISNAEIVGSSGVAQFDDSVLRAVMKASPVPPAPADLYNTFREVRITFDSN
ncbi:MAG: cell envelope integrity protein TolA [bacterium]|nr:cell envelope integrity protein TolA [bacterium]